MGQASAVERTKPPRVLYALYVAHSLAGGLGLLIPFVALVLVIAYGVGHVHVAPRLFLGFLTLTVFAGALPRAIRLGQTLRVGSLKVGGATIQRSIEPRGFWTWVAVSASFVAVNMAIVVLFAWVTLHWSA